MAKVVDKIPLGRELDWTEEEVDRLVQVTPSDVVSAQVLVQEGLPEEFRDLLDAEDEKQELSV